MSLIYSRKSTGPRMEPWGTPALTGYSCEHFPYENTQNHKILIKDKMRPNMSPEIPWDLSLWRKLACQTLSEVLDILSATARVAPELLKALVILSNTTARRSTVDQEDLKSYWKSEKGHISLWSKENYYLQVFQRI